MGKHDYSSPTLVEKPLETVPSKGEQNAVAAQIIRVMLQEPEGTK